MAYRANVHESTKCTPNLIILGREVSLPIDMIAGSPPNNQLLTNCPLAYVEWVRNALEMSFFFTVYENLKSS